MVPTVQVRQEAPRGLLEWAPQTSQTVRWAARRAASIEYAMVLRAADDREGDGAGVRAGERVLRHGHAAGGRDGEAAHAVVGRGVEELDGRGGGDGGRDGDRVGLGVARVRAGAGR